MRVELTALVKSVEGSHAHRGRLRSIVFVDKSLLSKPSLGVGKTFIVGEIVEERELQQRRVRAFDRMMTKRVGERRKNLLGQALLQGGKKYQYGDDFFQKITIIEMFRR